MTEHMHDKGTDRLLADMQAEHTPTPWHHEPGDDYIREESTGATIARICQDDGHCDSAFCRNMPAEANADLICRAVNAHDALVAACKRMQSWLHEYIGQNGSDPMDGGLAEMHNNLRAAISLAEPNP